MPTRADFNAAIVSHKFLMKSIKQLRIANKHRRMRLVLSAPWYWNCLNRIVMNETVKQRLSNCRFTYVTDPEFTEVYKYLLPLADDQLALMDKYIEQLKNK